MSAPLKALMVGFGGIARGLATDSRMAQYFPIATHAQALRADPNFDWVGVVDPDPVACQSARTEWQVAAFSDVAEAVPLAPDVLVLATPPTTFSQRRLCRKTAWRCRRQNAGRSLRRPRHSATGQFLATRR
jgi:hypothetical protein